MYIAVRRGNDESWILVSERSPGGDPDDPCEIVPVGQLVEIVPGIAVSLDAFELPDSRVIDLVGVDARGEITLALCRLARTAEIRRECVARLLELAAGLRRGLPFTEFEKRVQVLKGRPLADLVRDALPEGARADFDRRRFRLRLARNLAEGRFRLVLAVDRVDEPFGAFLDSLRKASTGTIRFCPVEIAQFEYSGMRVMIPRIEPGTFRDVPAGDPAAAASGKGQNARRGRRPPHRAEPAREVTMTITGRRAWEQRFFERLRRHVSPQAVRRARAILRLGRERVHALPAGWMASERGFSFQIALVRRVEDTVEPAVVELFRLESNGMLVIDAPMLRTLLQEVADGGHAPDVAQNPLLGAALSWENGSCEIGLDHAFVADREAASFCVAVRTLVRRLGKAA